MTANIIHLHKSHSVIFKLLKLFKLDEIQHFCSDYLICSACCFRNFLKLVSES